MMVDANSIIDITLKFWGEKLVPVDITSALKLEPTKFYRKGEVIPSKHEKSRIAKGGLWALSKKDLASSDIDNYVSKLVSILGQSGFGKQRIGNYEQAAICFTFGVTEESDSIDYVISPELISKISGLKINLSFTII